jgi:serine/threonine protein kinase
VDIWSLAIIFCCMTLRRFPWKLPRLTDSSFKLFAAEPTPGHDPKKLILPASSSTGALVDARLRDTEAEATPKHSEPAPKTDHDESKPQSTTEQPEKKEVIRGPWRILRLLPRESRHVIGRMLELDPKQRGKMDEILRDSWVADTVICRQIDPGFVLNAENHSHILEPPANATAK